LEQQCFDRVGMRGDEDVGKKEKGSGDRAPGERLIHLGGIIEWLNIHWRAHDAPLRNGWQWAEWRTPQPISIANWFRVAADGIFTLKPTLVPPNADCYARFQVQFFQDMLHVLLHGAGAAPENLTDLAVAFSSRNPLYYFALALR
jgi:hypothetical protein